MIKKFFTHFSTNASNAKVLKDMKSPSSSARTQQKSKGFFSWLFPKFESNWLSFFAVSLSFVCAYLLVFSRIIWLTTWPMKQMFAGPEVFSYRLNGLDVDVLKLIAKIPKWVQEYGHGILHLNHVLWALAIFFLFVIPQWQMWLCNRGWHAKAFLTWAQTFAFLAFIKPFVLHPTFWKFDGGRLVLLIVTLILFVIVMTLLFHICNRFFEKFLRKHEPSHDARVMELEKRHFMNQEMVKKYHRAMDPSSKEKIHIRSDEVQYAKERSTEIENWFQKVYGGYEQEKKDLSFSQRFGWDEKKQFRSFVYDWNLRSEHNWLGYMYLSLFLSIGSYFAYKVITIQYAMEAAIITELDDYLLRQVLALFSFHVDFNTAIFLTCVGYLFPVSALLCVWGKTPWYIATLFISVQTAVFYFFRISWFKSFFVDMAYPLHLNWCTINVLLTYFIVFIIGLGFVQRIFEAYLRKSRLEISPNDLYKEYVMVQTITLVDTNAVSEFSSTKVGDSLMIAPETAHHVAESSCRPLTSFLEAAREEAQYLPITNKKY